MLSGNQLQRSTQLVLNKDLYIHVQLLYASVYISLMGIGSHTAPNLAQLYISLMGIGSHTAPNLAQLKCPLHLNHDHKGTFYDQY
jgi:hypothetical protein